MFSCTFHVFFGSFCVFSCLFLPFLLSFSSLFTHFLTISLAFFLPLLSVALAIMQASKNISDYWLAFWLSNETSFSTPFFLSIFGTLAMITCLATLARSFWFAKAGLFAAGNVHDVMVDHVVKAPLTFFDANSIGRIVNRFSVDQFAVDDALPFELNILLARCALVVIWREKWAGNGREKVGKWAGKVCFLN